LSVSYWITRLSPHVAQNRSKFLYLLPQLEQKHLLAAKSFRVLSIFLLVDPALYVGGNPFCCVLVIGSFENLAALDRNVEVVLFIKLLSNPPLL
jgi:hypothetical protein